MSAGGTWLAVAYALTYVVNTGGALVMAGVAGMRLVELRKERDATWRSKLEWAMATPLFWWAFWVSGAALVLQLTLPFALFFYVPAGVAIAVVGANALTSLIIAVPLRLAIWDVHSWPSVKG